jgi:hypothetical protein
MYGRAKNPDGGTAVLVNDHSGVFFAILLFITVLVKAVKK